MTPAYCVADVAGIIFSSSEWLKSRAGGVRGVEKSADRAYDPLMNWAVPRACSGAIVWATKVACCSNSVIDGGAKPSTTRTKQIAGHGCLSCSQKSSFVATGLICLARHRLNGTALSEQERQG